MTDDAFTAPSPGIPVIVGAGAAGLAVAATLRQRGVPCTVLERAQTIGSAWSGRYDSLHLHTIRWLSGLPGEPIPRAFGRWVARDDMVRYLTDYANRFDVSPELGVEVTRVDPADDGWVLQTSTGSRSASAVVLATSYSNVPLVPPWPGADGFKPPLTHSTEYRNAYPYAGQRVLVVGAGNSAAEIAVDLVAAGAQVDLSVRTPPNIVRRDTFGVPSQLLGIALRRVPEPVMNRVARLLRRVSVPDLSAHGLPAPSGDGFSQFLRTRTVPILDHGFVREVRAGRVTVVGTVDHLDGSEVILVDGSVLRPDAVICATGFRPGLEPLVGHLDVLDDRGAPLVHGARTLPQAPGLYFAAITILLSGLLREIGLEARSIGDALAAETAGSAGAPTPVKQTWVA
jgi:putative flavoprotein involved in K+ transport